MARAQKAEWKRGMEEQLEEARQKRIAALQEAQYERLWVNFRVPLSLLIKSID